MLLDVSPISPCLKSKPNPRIPPNLPKVSKEHINNPKVEKQKEKEKINPEEIKKN